VTRKGGAASFFDAAGSDFSTERRVKPCGRVTRNSNDSKRRVVGLSQAFFQR
jgi:hypothetical protein